MIQWRRTFWTVAVFCIRWWSLYFKCPIWILPVTAPHELVIISHCPCCCVRVLSRFHEWLEFKHKISSHPVNFVCWFHAMPPRAATHFWECCRTKRFLIKSYEIKVCSPTREFLSSLSKVRCAIHIKITSNRKTLKPNGYFVWAPEMASVVKLDRLTIYDVEIFVGCQLQR